MSNQNLNSGNAYRQITSREDREEDIVIIGAGLAGLTAAIILARAGRSLQYLNNQAKWVEEQEQKI
jgi:ribulose 1,5-bisphosphate synthetase/thiazole synthase